MFSSPAKRRKTSETTAVDASQTNQDDQPAPSFQQPTISSLARRGSDISTHLNRSPTRSPQRRTSRGSQPGRKVPESRVFGLRDRKALRPSLGSASPSVSQFSPRRRSGGVQAFAIPPRRVSKRIAPSDLTFGSPATKTQAPEPQDNTPEDQLASGLADAVGEADDAEPIPFISYDGADEPDLPPTPTQLGIEPAPGGQKGLMSSSPSTRLERRTRRRLADPVKSSPLKFKGADEVEAEDLSGTALALDGPLLPEAVLKKQNTKRDLSAELQRLKDDIGKLNDWNEKLNRPGGELESEDFSRLISMLTSVDHSHTSQSSRAAMPVSSLLSTLLPFSKKTPRTRETSPFPTNPFALQDPKQAELHLTAFAPLALTAQSNKVSSDTESIRETHNLTLSAPPPFPSNLYSIPISYETNPETQTLISISVSDEKTNDSNVPEALQDWMDTRLANPLLKLDISGLCWGINRYWEASVSRARIWSRLEKQHPKLLPSRTKPGLNRQKPNNKNTKKPNLRGLIPHLERSSMLFESSRAPKILLSCPLTIDEWTSEPHLDAGITVSPIGMGVHDGSGRKIEQDVKGLFHALLGERRGGCAPGTEVDIDAVVRAMGGVLGAVFGVDT